VNGGSATVSKKPAELDRTAINTTTIIIMARQQATRSTHTK
jgi:hypothetical protein